MTAQTPPYAIQASSHGAELFRRMAGSLLPAGVSQQVGTAARGGIVYPGDLAVTQNGTPNMSVNVAAGQVWIPGTIGANQGPYYGLNDGTVNLSVSAANATNPRIDLVCATVNDAAYSGSTNNWVLQVVTGTPSAGATLSNLTGAPSLPSSSLKIAYILVPANASSIVTADISDVRINAGIEPACRVYRNAAYTAVNGVITLLPFDTIQIDNFSGFSTSTHLYTVPVAGLYAVSTSTLWNITADQITVASYIQHNGSSYSTAQQVAGGANSISSPLPDLVACVVGDTIGADYYVSGTPGIATGSVDNFLSIVKVSN